MNVPGLLLSCGLSFVFLCLVFRPLELAFPARSGQRFFRPAWLTDLGFFAGQYLLWNGVIFWLLGNAGVWLQSGVPLGIRASVASQSWWAQAIEVVFLSDLCVYWGHRLQHRVGWLWRFHSIHHSAEHLDWLAAHREHPVDTVYTLTLINLPAFLLGFPLETLAGLIAFRGIWAIYIHSNVRLPIGPLRVFVGAPELHHWHHDRDRDFGNYANVSPLMDVLSEPIIVPPASRRASAFGKKCREGIWASWHTRSAGERGARPTKSRFPMPRKRMKSTASKSCQTCEGPLTATRLSSSQAGPSPAAERVTRLRGKHRVTR